MSFSISPARRYYGPTFNVLSVEIISIVFCLIKLMMDGESPLVSVVLVDLW